MRVVVGCGVVGALGGGRGGGGVVGGGGGGGGLGWVGDVIGSGDSVRLASRSLCALLASSIFCCRIRSALALFVAIRFRCVVVRGVGGGCPGVKGRDSREVGVGCVVMLLVCKGV